MSAISAADIYTDLSGPIALKAQANADSPQALRAVAAQFEALFTQMLLKRMRATDFGGGLFDSDQSRFYRDLFDQQLAINLSAGRGLGMADLLLRQLGAPAPQATGAAVSQVKTDSDFASPQEFIRTLAPQAQKTAAALGVAPAALLAQAALESGWGGKIIRSPDGRNSYNVFGIKADSTWAGARVSAPTLEYINGTVVKGETAFRAYDSYSAAFADYAGFLQGNPRYREVLNAGRDPDAFIRALGAAGYASDPAYSEKLQAILAGNYLADLKLPADMPLTETGPWKT